MAKYHSIAYRISDFHYQLAEQKATEQGYKSRHDMARAALLRTIDSDHCLSNLILQNHEGIKTNQEMLQDLALTLLIAFEADHEKTSQVLNVLEKYV